jgi:hypothetical protein
MYIEVNVRNSYNRRSHSYTLKNLVCAWKLMTSRLSHALKSNIILWVGIIGEILYRMRVSYV